jgi:hypothetical protein
MLYNYNNNYELKDENCNNDEKLLNISNLID